jgi:hypothetical protein
MASERQQLGLKIEIKCSRIVFLVYLCNDFKSSLQLLFLPLELCLHLPNGFLQSLTLEVT